MFEQFRNSGITTMINHVPCVKNININGFYVVIIKYIGISIYNGDFTCYESIYVSGTATISNNLVIKYFNLYTPVGTTRATTMGLTSD
jgi:hypothetical protein